MSSISEEDRIFCRQLPKVELHAHLTGSISRHTLHEIWQRKRDTGELRGSNALEDPLVAIPPAANGVNITTFFPIFSTHIYHLLSTPEDITYSTLSVLASFLHDGVTHLELRTTPRASAGLTKEAYVSLILDLIAGHNTEQDRMQTYLILSVDRRGSIAEAEETVSLALQLRDRGVVGVDLCGDPTRGDVRAFRPAFARAREAGLGITVHFGEVQGEWVEDELMELLSWRPGRLGHVICLSDKVKDEVKRLGCGLELCLSCNVLAGMSDGGFSGHHFGGWWGGKSNGVALSTDDVGIFESELSEEYALAMQHFTLTKKEAIDMSKEAVKMTFAGVDAKRRALQQLEAFENANEVEAGKHHLQQKRNSTHTH
ncbi:hypothetical protein CAC42_4921 [Sphaceloma murrayae]|uniref:Adenosine deaminase domain-containing protein n=1 Tax=Sphaceloma murrayae TaxID=2082308 RepID=A0A2K1QPD2_9PEZI|nr:hypothetical protein CAC42_4921 [Sphaceloma murrayae]